MHGEVLFVQLGGVAQLPAPKSITIRGQTVELYTLVGADGVQMNLRNGSSFYCRVWCSMGA